MSNTESNLNQASQDNSEQRSQIESKPLSRSLFAGLGIAALVLGVVTHPSGTFPPATPSL
jgi:hypothetical protein